MGKSFTASSESRTSLFVELPNYMEVADFSRTIITVSEYFSCRANIRFFPGHSLFLIISYYHNDYRELHSALATIHLPQIHANVANISPKTKTQHTEIATYIVCH